MSDPGFSQKALSDLRDIWIYTADRWGVAQAESYTRNIRAVCDDLAAGLKAGRGVEARAGYLRYSVSRHVIYFRESGTGIVVVRVLHQRMDVGRHLRE